MLPANPQYLPGSNQSRTEVKTPGSFVVAGAVFRVHISTRPATLGLRALSSPASRAGGSDALFHALTFCFSSAMSSSPPAVPLRAVGDLSCNVFTTFDVKTVIEKIVVLSEKLSARNGKRKASQMSRGYLGGAVLPEVSASWLKPAGLCRPATANHSHSFWKQPGAYLASRRTLRGR